MSESYQVLARKYRPHTFNEMVGQTYITKTLINALDMDHLHHGFLFTGTRGVGKTTIARIFAKSINCESGVSSTPCGECETCIEIDKGQSIDLIELDAASHTGVDNMRDILENAQYMPTKNRYKVYLIDEVHMLSKSSFNALLKTLEEPPEHIKFLLATTDPQKIPVTVLSRCLQFALQKLTHKEIFDQLKFIMNTEGIEYEELALSQIADFGNGSMRDAISLLDQSISYGNGSVLAVDIKKMLGLVHHDDILTLAKYLISLDAHSIVDFVKKLSHKGENLTNALKDLSSLFHQIAITQIMDNSQTCDKIKALSMQISNQDLQLFYHIAIHGTKEMLLAPSEQIGFEMTLLRMLSLHSGVVTLAEKKTLKLAKTKAQTLNKQISQVESKLMLESEFKLVVTPQPELVALNAIKDSSKATLNISTQAEWEVLINTFNFNTLERMLIKNTVFKSFKNQVLTLSLDTKVSNMFNDNIRISIQNAIQKKFEDVILNIDLNKLTEKTLAQKEIQDKNKKTAILQKKFLADKGVQKLQQVFNTKIDFNSIKEAGNV